MAYVLESHVREAFSSRTSTALLPEVPECGRSDQHAARPGLWPHQHPNAFEVCLLARSEVDWWVEDRVVTLRAGQIFFTRPGERHGSIGSMVHPCELYWFHLAERPTPGAGDLNGAVASIRQDLMSLPVRTFDASPDLQRSIRALVDEHRHPDRYAVLAARAALHTALALLIREGRATRAPEISEPVRHALTWMATHVEEAFTVPDVAAAVGLSTVRLQSRFRRELHCSVGEHHNRLRLHTAKLLLRDTDDPITEIAHRLGFASSQYFATFFRERVGVPPSGYRHQLRPALPPLGSVSISVQ